MVVYFLRHAEAEPDADNDFDRKLTPKGLEQAEKAGKFCARNGLVPDLIVSSPVLRAKQTAKIVAQKLGADLAEVHWLACGMANETCLKELRAMERHGSVMLVGHEPDFSEAAAFLLGLPDSDAVKIRKASLTAVDLPEIRPGRGQLQFLVPVRLM